MTIDRSKFQGRAQAILDRIEPPSSEKAGANDRSVGLLEEIEYGVVWSRDGLDLQDRLVASLTTACLLNLQTRIRKYALAALANDLSAVEIREIFLQTGIYGGFAVTEAAIDAVSDLLGDHAKLSGDASIEIISGVDAMSFRRDLHGPRHNDSYADPSRKHAGELYEIATSYGYGMIWRRPGLSLRRRFICSLAGFASLGAAPQSFRKFALSARAFGLSIEEIRETVIQTAPISGFPKALLALMILEDAFGADTETASVAGERRAGG